MKRSSQRERFSRACLFAAIAAVSSAGCHRVARADGEEDDDSAISLASIAVSPPSLLVAKKSPRVAYLVLDPLKVPSKLPVLVTGEDRGGKLTKVDAFVERDLKAVFSNYFSEVRVVAPGAPIPDAPHVVIDVKVERFEILLTAKERSGIMVTNHGYAVVKWGLAMRLSEGADYLYSFAGESSGAPSADPKFAVRSAFEQAITDMLKGYTDKEIHHKVLEAPPPPTAGAIST